MPRSEGGTRAGQGREGSGLDGQHLLWLAQEGHGGLLGSNTLYRNCPALQRDDPCQTDAAPFPLYDPSRATGMAWGPLRSVHSCPLCARCSSLVAALACSHFRNLAPSCPTPRRGQFDKTPGPRTHAPGHCIPSHILPFPCKEASQIDGFPKHHAPRSFLRYGPITGSWRGARQRHGQRTAPAERTPVQGSFKGVGEG